MRIFLIFVTWLIAGAIGHAQNGVEDDIWRQVSLNNVDYQKSKNYCVRLYGYYRYVDDGINYVKNREWKDYNVHEGILSIDIRYSKDEDDGGELLAARNLLHPDRRGEIMSFYELKPYTFLEKARKVPKHYSMEVSGDTTRVYCKRGLAGIAVRDTANHELRMNYNALAPDTIKSINLLIAKASLRNVHADAVYQINDNEIDYVPQGQLKRISFDGDVDAYLYGENAYRAVYHEHNDFYVDSVVYMTKDEYKADKKLSWGERRERSGYTEADIDRLKQKLNVPPLSAEVRQRMEDQLDWEDAQAQWEQLDKVLKATKKAGSKMMESEAFQQMEQKVQQQVEKMSERKQGEGE